MFRRATFLVFLAAQLAASASPAAAVLLCLSEDGCASLEFAAPGTVRCPEADCDPHGGDEHSCRDIPVLAAAQDIARGALPGVSQAPLANATPCQPLVLTGRAGGVAPATDASARPPALRQLRSVVLTL